MYVTNDVRARPRLKGVATTSSDAVFERRSRSTRDRPAKAPLSYEAVIDAALAIVRSDGLEAVSMRRVATALDTGPGSLYVYVRSRDELVSAMVERVTETVELEVPDRRRWRAQLVSLLTRSRDAFTAYPGTAAATMIDPPQTEAILRYLENLFGLLLAGGIDAQNAAWAADILVAQVTYAAIEAELRSTDASELADRSASAFSLLPADRFPLITSHIDELTAGSVDDRFRFAIDVVLDGVLARAERRSAPRRRL